MNNSKTKVLSFRVPVEVAEKVDMQVQLNPLGGRQRLIENIFIPAFTRFVKKRGSREKKEVAAR